MRKLCAYGLLLSLALAACVGNAADSGAQVAGLEARVAELEAQLAEMQAEPGDDHADDHDSEMAASRHNVALTQYILDTAGFHAIDDALAETATIDPAYLATTNRVRKVVAQTEWPEELHEQAEALAALLEEFAGVLESDDAEEAASLAAEVHTAQHDLSAAIDEWLGEGHEHGHGG